MRKKFLLVSVLLLSALLLTGCRVPNPWPGLSADKDTAYLANNLSVTAIRLKDGQQVWQYPVQSDSKLAFYANPVIAPNGLVIFGSSGVEHNLFAVDPKKFPNTPVQSVNGIQKFFCGIGLATCPEYKVEQWIFTGAKDHWVASPLLVNDKVFAPNADGSLYVLDLNKGTLLKKIDLGGDMKTPNRLWSQPVSDGKNVFVTSLEGKVFAVDAKTFEIQWHKDLASAIPGAPVLGSDGMLYVGSYAKQLERFEPATGKHESAIKAKGWIWGTPVADGDNLYFSDVDGYVYSYNTKTGKLNWDAVQPDSTSAERAITASPLVQTDRILVATESGDIYAINKADGKVTSWHKVSDNTSKGKAYTTPIFAGDYVLVAYSETNYYLIALEQDGYKPKWTFPQGN